MDSLFITKNLMCMVKYANLGTFFYKQYPQAITIYTSIFLENKKEEIYFMNLWKLVMSRAKQME